MATAVVETVASSEFNLNLWGASAGLRTPTFVLADGADHAFFGSWLAATYGHVSASGSRSIAHCSNCSEQNLALPSGSFVEVASYTGLVASPLGMVLKVAHRNYTAKAFPSYTLTGGFGITWL